MGSPTNAFAYPAPWCMIQWTVVGDCSSLLFTQLWLAEWSVERGEPPLLRPNFERQDHRGHGRRDVHAATAAASAHGLSRVNRESHDSRFWTTCPAGSHGCWVDATARSASGCRRCTALLVRDVRVLKGLHVVHGALEIVGVGGQHEQQPQHQRREHLVLLHEMEATTDDTADAMLSPLLAFNLGCALHSTVPIEIRLREPRPEELHLTGALELCLDGARSRRTCTHGW
ncbi:hypothetical protein PINS_up004687 [Pythium insidiosum]|nr:hypothetical protein PINS_up004687 [Pythium insidiosum]